MKHKINKKIIIILLICVGITSIAIFRYAYAYNVTNSDDVTVLTVSMDEGIITIVGTSHAASTNTRWRTIGLNITVKKVPENQVTVKEKTGPGNVSQVYSDGHGQLLFTSADHMSETKVGDNVISTWVFNADRVENALGVDFDNISKGTTVYMHGIFETYYNDTGEKIDTMIENWQDIMKAETWGSQTLEDFEKYFNMPVEFMPRLQKSYKHYYTDDWKWLKEKTPLADHYPGENLWWNNNPMTIEGENGTTYKLYKYVVTKSGTSPKDGTILKEGNITEQGTTASIPVKLGGMHVFMIYKKVTSYKNTLYYQLEDGTNIQPSTSLGSYSEGDTLTWDNAPSHIQYNNTNYNLSSYYVAKKSAPTVKINYGKVKTSSGSFTPIAKGGMNVHLIYVPNPITPTPIPSNVPTPTPVATTTPIPIPIAVPEQKTITATINNPETTGVIRADNRGSEKFVVNLGVPTTESLFTNVQSDNYLMGYELIKQTGIKTYPVKVTKKYILKWKGKDASGVIDKTDIVTVEQVVSIKRAYGYWEISNFDLYRIENAHISNYALPNGSATMVPDYSSGYSVPSVSSSHSSDEKDHIILPDTFINGIELESETISVNTTIKPTLKKEDFTYVADGILPQLKVKNDSLTINSIKIISGQIVSKDGEDINEVYLSQVKMQGREKCNNNVLYKPYQIIEATKKNGTYQSSGMLTYTRVEGVNSLYGTNIQSNIANLSNVVIHTPVLCDAVVTSDNDKYVQLVRPSSAVQLVLDPNPLLNDFTLNISNYGLHSYKQGYFTRDFSRSLRDPDKVSYIASENGHLLNEVKFPFDVYIKKSGDDKFIKKNTWVVLGRDTATFYLPMWVQEGTYKALCRTIAVNADMSKLDVISEARVNSELFNYVATDTFNVEVSGRIYGLTIYDLTDYPIWEEVFRAKNSLQLKLNNKDKYPDGTNKSSYSKNYSYYYSVGTNNQYGNDTTRDSKYTFPLVNGSHPFYTNIGVLKTGYVVRFKLDTIGTMYGSGCSVKIKPSFYWVDKNGNNRTRVDIYYEEEINGTNKRLVKMGNNLDKTNVKYMKVGSPYVGIPKAELKNTSSLLNIKYSNFIARRDKIFTFMDINILSTFRTFINTSYAKNIVNSSEYSRIQDTGITQSTLMKQMQRWYGCYYLPGIMHAVNPANVPNGWTVYQYAERIGITYNENWWKKDGYIIVNFDVVTVDSQGNEHLSYINANNYLKKGNCSMWVTEGAPLSKTDYSNDTFKFFAGDFIMYYVNKSVNDDYSASGLY